MLGTQSERVVTPRQRLASARLYLCTDARRERGDLAEFADAALAGGVDIIQLRDKGSPGEQRFGPLEARAELGVLAEFKAAARRHGALVAVNDRADVALAAGADVLHVGQGDLPAYYARRILGPDVVIGRSTHTQAQLARAANDENIDYFCVGPVWATPTKPDRAPVGTQLVQAATAAAPTLPWFAIGGVNAAALPELIAAGATRIVVVRAITAASDPEAAARALKDQLALASSVRTGGPS